MLKLIVVDDHPTVRQGLGRTLSAKHDIELLSVAENGKQALEQMEKSLPDVLVTDLKMPVVNGLQLIRETKLKWPRVKISVLTSFSDAGNALTSLRLGADAFVPKDSSPERLVDVLRGLNRDLYDERVLESWRIMSRNSIVPSAKLGLTEREDIDLLQVSFLFDTFVDISRALSITPKEARLATEQLLWKAGLSDMQDLRLVAVASGVVGFEHLVILKKKLYDAARKN
jgi:DNA-binding NarL/FixJ family response regulator